MFQQVAFYFFALVVAVAAWRVVTAKDMIRAALALVVVLAGMAPLFILMAGEFVAVVQILVYVGAVIILFLFGLMLTRSGKTTSVDRSTSLVAGVVSAGLFAALTFAVIDAFGEVEVAPSTIGTTARVGDVLLRQYVIAFEAISVLLLAALVGSIVLARRD